MYLPLIKLVHYLLCDIVLKLREYVYYCWVNLVIVNAHLFLTLKCLNREHFVENNVPFHNFLRKT